MQTDAELLRQYVEEGSEAAFAELVRRYLRLVYSAAARQAGGNGSLAEDVTQSVFVILARQGPSLVGHESLAGWMHTCTRYTTLRALRGERRRQQRELKAAAMPTEDTPKACWDEVRPLLDEAVGKLNASDRQAVLLRFFQGQSHRQVGAALGVTEDAARVRVDRALEKLRRHFAGRGIVATAVVLGEVISAHAAEVEPAGLAGRVGRRLAPGSHAARLATGGVLLRIIFMSTKKKILIAAALVLLVGLLSLAVPRWKSSTAKEQAPAAGNTSLAASPPKKTMAVVQAPLVEPVPASATNADAPAVSSASGRPLAAGAPSGPPPLAGKGVYFGTGGNAFRNQYRNFFALRKLTQDQQSGLLKILTDQQDKTGAVTQGATSKLSKEQQGALMNNALKQMTANGPPPSDAWVLANAINENFYEQLGITDQLNAINEATDAQLQQLLGEENYQAYVTYTQQDGVREWVTRSYGNALQAAGVDGLTPAQQEALVGIVANSIKPDDSYQRLSHLPEVVEQAGAILAPEQIEVLKTNPTGSGLSYARLHRTP